MKFNHEETKTQSKEVLPSVFVSFTSDFRHLTRTFQPFYINFSAGRTDFLAIDANF
jgi:hypothetical protein